MAKDTYVRFRCTQKFKERLEDIADAQTGGDVSQLCREILYRSILHRETMKAKGKLKPISGDVDETQEWGN